MGILYTWAPFTELHCHVSFFSNTQHRAENSFFQQICNVHLLRARQLLHLHEDYSKAERLSDFAFTLTLERVVGYLSEKAHWRWNLKSEKMPARQSVFLAYVMPWEGNWRASWRSCKETRWSSPKQGRGENRGDKKEAGNPESGPQKHFHGLVNVLKCWLDKWLHWWMDRQMDGYKDRWMGRWMDGNMDRWWPLNSEGTQIWMWAIIAS